MLTDPANITGCHICGAEQLDLLSNYHSLPRVASDCVPWPPGGKLAVCLHCHCVQNPVDTTWYQETSEIYSQYRIYEQSAGSEQGIIIDAGKKSIPRSEKIFQHVFPYLKLDTTGRLLDIGCANGELLRSFKLFAPEWTMVGFEIDDQRRGEVEKIPGVEAFVSGSLDKINKQFNLITLIHVFEHLPHPKNWLEKIRRLLAPNGMILIQVPDPKKNPYNLLVADHCSHFLMSNLIYIAEQTDYEIVTHSDDWVSREYTLLLRPRPRSIIKKATVTKTTLDKASTYPKTSLQWLYGIIDLAKNIPKNNLRGIWGTAIAATWVYSVMDNEIDFFVDEDPHRIGQKHLGRPIYSPEMIPHNSHVFIALTPEIANNITTRWSNLKAVLHCPPDLIY